MKVRESWAAGNLTVRHEVGVEADPIFADGRQRACGPSEVTDAINAAPQSGRYAGPCRTLVLCHVARLPGPLSQDDHGPLVAAGGAGFVHRDAGAALFPHQQRRGRRLRAAPLRWTHCLDPDQRLRYRQHHRLSAQSAADPARKHGPHRSRARGRVLDHPAIFCIRWSSSSRSL
jgi:hypothetical protein